MSRIGNRPITVPDKVNISLDGNVVHVEGPKGKLSQEIDREINVAIEDGVINVSRPTEQRRHRAQHGLARTLIANMVQGVSEGHSKALEVHGVGYRVTPQGKGLTLNLGYSHPIEVSPQDNIEFEVQNDDKKKVTTIIVKGIDKAQVGQTAADIRRARRPDPYKGKGVRYQGERVRLRQGKRVTS